MGDSDQNIDPNGRCPKKHFTSSQRKNIYAYLLEHSSDGYLQIGQINQAAEYFSISRRSVGRIWKRAQNSKNNGEPADVSSLMCGRVGRKRNQVDLGKIVDIPLRSRTNIRSLAVAMKMKKSTVHNRVKDGLIKPHTNAIKPYLTDENKKRRLGFCLTMLDYTTIYTNPTFHDMYNVIHIDEKWFYMSNTTERYYMLPCEDEPLRTCKSKKFIDKIMFLAAVARPRYDRDGNEVFSGKIGIFPFVNKVPAKRKSKNRPAGTLETKPIETIDKEVYRTCLIEKLLPAIRSNWPTNSSGPIFVQQDNAKPHINVNDSAFCEASTQDGFDIWLFFQPPNSPDMNVLDLVFFRAIQSLQHQNTTCTINGLIEAVEKAFWDYPSQSLNKVFLSLQMSMIEVMKVKGGINYKAPHMGKDSLERANNLPRQLSCDPMLVRDAIAYLETPEN